MDPRDPKVIKNEKSLAAWFKRQRVLHQNGQLSTDRAARLEELPNWQWSSSRAGPNQQQNRDWGPSLKTLVDWPTLKINYCHFLFMASATAKGENSLASWFRKHFALFRASRQALQRVRLRSKTRLPPSMHNHRVVLFEAFLKRCGQWPPEQATFRGR